MGGKVPEKFYMSKGNFFPPDATIQKVTIDARSSFVVKYDIGNGGNKALRYYKVPHDLNLLQRTTCRHHCLSTCRQRHVLDREKPYLHGYVM